MKTLVIIILIVIVILIIGLTSVLYYEKYESNNTEKTNLDVSSSVIWPKPVNSSISDTLVEICGLNISVDTLEVLKTRFSQLKFPQGSTGVSVELGDEPNPELNIDIDESYSISYLPNENIIIKATNIYGAMHALVTLRQIVRSDGTKDFIPKSVDIQDKPAFSYRGLLIDTGRVYLPTDLIKKTIDTMAFVKLNVLHWHLTDAQNFPYVAPSHPELAEKGSTGKTYSQQDIKYIVAYAKARGVGVMVEIDTPAHSYSWGLSHPELVSCMDIQTHEACPEPPCGALNIADDTKLPKIKKIVQDVWNDVIDATCQPMLHIGGDELKKGCVPDIKDLQKKFEEYMNDLSTSFIKKGKRVMMWEDILGPYLGTGKSPIDKSIIIETWLGDHVPEVIKLGHKVVATGTFWYLDVGRNTFFLDSPSWTMFAAWQYMYNRDITKGVDPSQAKNVLGGEVCVWGETIDQTNFDPLTWPRASTVAEVLWSNPTFNTNSQGVKTRLQEGSNNMRTDVWRRFQNHRQDLLALGVSASPVTPPFCVQGDVCAKYANDGSRNKVVWPSAPLSVPGLLSYCTKSDPCIGVNPTDVSQKMNDDNTCAKGYAKINDKCIKIFDKTCPPNTIPTQQLDDDWDSHTVCMGSAKLKHKQTIPTSGLQQNNKIGLFPGTFCYDTNGWTMANIN